MPAIRDERQALQKESQRVQAALDAFAELGLSRTKRKPAPARLPTGLAPASIPEMVWKDEPAIARIQLRPEPEPEPAPPPPVPDVADGFFSDFDSGDQTWNPSLSSSPQESQSPPSENDFDPGSGLDFSEGFGAEINLEAKAGQDTAPIPQLSEQNTPADGLPAPASPQGEAINDVLDGFNW
jgi:hypothetical protein